jgi:transposase
LDKGYDYDAVRSVLQEVGFTAHLRRRDVETQAMAREAGKTARRWGIERSHRWLNRIHRILVRGDKKPEN